MPLDTRIKDAIRESIQELDQPEEVSSRLGAWLEAIAEGNEQLTDRDSVHRRIELLYDSVVVDVADDLSQEE